MVVAQVPPWATLIRVRLKFSPAAVRESKKPFKYNEVKQSIDDWTEIGGNVII